MVSNPFRSGLLPALLSALALALLAGCGSTPMAPDSAGRAPDERPGGYYQDDGPHANPPADLASIPDPVPRVEPLHRYANRPYQALGQSFTPATSVKPFSQRGKASWYGRKFHGKRTASGEPYDMYKMTAAHPTLPIPSYARVTNLDNGRSVVVRINDRGPFLHGRVIDLSYTAAYKLGYIEKGSTQVEVTAIVPGEEVQMADGQPVRPLRQPGVAVVETAAVAVPELPEAAPIEALPPPLASIPSAAAASTGEPPPLAADVSEAAAGGTEPAASEESPAAPEVVADGSPAADAGDKVQHFIQLGAFSSRANAEDFRDMAAGELGEPVERLQVVPLGLRFRLHLGPYATVEEARAQADRVGAVLKLKPFVVSR